MFCLQELFQVSIYCLILQGSSGSPILETLHASQIIFRHGARTMDSTIPTDPYKDESFWPDGYHQLTCIGKTQGYLLGQFIRKRYSGFISRKYRPKEIHVLSSNMDRCIQTADSVMAGLYNNQVIHENNEDCNLINWTPIPIHSIPEEYDNILKQTAVCPKYSKLFSIIEKEPESSIEKVMKDNVGEKFLADFIKYVGLDQSYYLDSLMIQHYYNFTLPDWTKPLFIPPAEDNMSRAYFKSLTRTHEMKRLRAGPAWTKLIANFNEAIESVANVPKRFHFFSGHDYTLSTIMDALGLYSALTITRFASALFIELHQIPSRNLVEYKYFEVKIYFRNENHGDAFELKVPGCGTPCSYEKFLNLIKPFLPNNWERECQDTLDFLE